MRSCTKSNQLQWELISKFGCLEEILNFVRIVEVARLDFYYATTPQYLDITDLTLTFILMCIIGMSSPSSFFISIFFIQTSEGWK